MKPKGDVVDLIERRTLLKGLAAGLAGAVAAPDSAAADAADVAAPESADGAQGPAASAAPASPRFLDDHARRTLSSLAELLVPGSVAAGVIDLIDRVAAVDSPSRQRRLLNALGRFDQEARTAHDARWIDLDEGVRVAILRQASTAPESQPQPPAWVKGQPMVFESTVPPGPATLRDHFEYLRASVANAYYTTEPGMKELGWTGQTAWKELPGCTHPSPEHE
jgi:hypothetical protein